MPPMSLRLTARCAANQHVGANACHACNPGMSRPAGDDATGGDTACEVIECEENKHVVGNACHACPDGMTRPAGDHASGPDTECAAA